MMIRKRNVVRGLLLCLPLLFLPGCASNEKKQIQEAVEKELEQLKSEDSSLFSEDIASVFATFYDDFSYKIDNIKIEGDTAVARASLKLPDTKALAEDFTAASLEKHIELDAGPSEVSFSSGDSSLLLKNLMESGDYKTKTICGDISLKKEEDAWQVVHTSELDNLLTGDFFLYTTDSKLLSPSKITEIHLNAIKKFDAEQLKTYLSLDNLLNTDDEYRSLIAHAIAEQIHQTFDFQINGEETQDTSALVRANITSVDFQTIISTYQSALSEWLKTSESLAVGADGRREKERKLLLETIQNNKAAISHEVEIPLENDGVNWKIQMNDQLSQAVFGDVQDAISSISVDVQ